MSAPWRLAVPDPSYRLSASEAADLQPEIDVAALERYLSHIAPEFRSDALENFTMRALNPDWHVYEIDIPDVELASLYDAIWEPRWQTLSPDQLSELLHAMDRLPPGLRTAARNRLNE